jgi:hypothetical protein
MFVNPWSHLPSPAGLWSKNISKHWKVAEKTTSLHLKKMMNLPREHQDETLQEENLHVVNMVKEPSESHVSNIRDVKGVSLSKAKMKVDKVREPPEPQ